MSDDQVESPQTLSPLEGGYKNKRHGHCCSEHETPEYSCWHSMKSRCFNSNWHQFSLYGGRGITVCERWLKFENFIADMGLRPSAKHSIERLDSNGNYEKSNCTWATRSQQMRNTSYNVRLTLDGQTRCLVEWVEITGLSRDAITNRLRRGWTHEEALTRSMRVYNKKPRQQSLGGLLPSNNQSARVASDSMLCNKNPEA